jgi:predicted alpha/beta superfamily hydrolase
LKEKRAVLEIFKREENASAQGRLCVWKGERERESEERVRERREKEREEKKENNNKQRPFILFFPL